MVSSIRRLAADHAALHNSDLPPNYLSPTDETASDDLTKLDILLTGPQGTPYSGGLWRLHLKMPDDYPKSPPKAAFKTRIWHPNVEELTGAVCVDTLKRDWEPSLTLRDVLVTISCLLIYPNPDSALNSAAGALLQDDYEAFARQARLMTSIHAPIPAELKNAAMQAKLRGEDAGTIIPEQDESDLRPVRTTRSGTRISSLTMKKKVVRNNTANNKNNATTNNTANTELSDDENETENMATASKENDPSLSPSPVKFAASPSPRKNALGKRPLSVLEMPVTDSDTPMLIDDNTDMNMTDIDGMMTASEKNIAANAIANNNINLNMSRETSSPQRKSPKLSAYVLKQNPIFSSAGAGTGAGLTGTSSGRIWDDNGDDGDMGIYEDDDDNNAPDDNTRLQWSTRPSEPSNHYGTEKKKKMMMNNNNNIPSSPSKGMIMNNMSMMMKSRNQSSSSPSSSLATTLVGHPSSSKVSSSSSSSKPVTGSRKVSSSSMKSKKAKPRIGIRRL